MLNKSLKINMSEMFYFCCTLNNDIKIFLNAQYTNQVKLISASVKTKKSKQVF